MVADALPTGFDSSVKYIPFNVANISAARNLGIGAAAGEVIAFIDDDAIPDPSWLTRLTTPLIDARIGASSGFTRGRNGISRQWGAMRFDLAGQDHPLDLDENQAVHIFDADSQQPVKLLGVNMAFRAAALRGVGGFDEAFRFFLEDADIKLRLDQAGWKSAVVPDAQVQHKYAASERRTEQRVPTDLTEIGASKAYFCKKHLKSDVPSALDAFTAHQNERVMGLAKAQHGKLMASLAGGYAAGSKRQSRYLKSSQAPQFQKFPIKSGPHVVLCTRRQDSAWLQSCATRLSDAGCRVCVIQMVSSIRYFQARFQAGYWLHRGGVFGKSTRSQPLISPISYTARFDKEIARITKQFPADLVAYNQSGSFAPETKNLVELTGLRVIKLSHHN